jgi:hypothetical protein
MPVVSVRAIASDEVEVVAHADPFQYKRLPNVVPEMCGIDDELVMYEATDVEEKY